MGITSPLEASTTAMSACVGRALLNPASSSPSSGSFHPASSLGKRRRPVLRAEGTAAAVQIVNGTLRKVDQRQPRKKQRSPEQVTSAVASASAGPADNAGEAPGPSTTTAFSVIEASRGEASMSEKPARPLITRAKTRYFCQHSGCDKSYTKPVRLAEHERSHTGERPFVCSEEGCSAKYLRESHLTAHMRTHRDENEKPLGCTEEDCDKRFWTNQHLQRHVKLVHEKDKGQYECQECPAAFNKHHKLRAHVAEVHMPEGANPFPCTHAGCGKSFKTGSKLRSHAKVHDETRYICMHASHRLASAEGSPPGQAPKFPTWSALQAHNKLAHPPACPHPECDGKVFKNTKALKKHRIAKHLQGVTQSFAYEEEDGEESDEWPGNDSHFYAEEEEDEDEEEEQEEFEEVAIPVPGGHTL